MTFKVIQGYWKWHELIGHMIIFLLVVYTNNASISRHFFHTTSFTVYVTACRGPNLETSFIFRKTIAIKDHRYFLIHVYTHSEVDTCHVY